MATDEEFYALFLAKLEDLGRKLDDGNQRLDETNHKLEEMNARLCSRAELQASPSASPTSSPPWVVAQVVPIATSELSPEAPTRCSTAGPNQDARVLVPADSSSASPTASPTSAPSTGVAAVVPVATPELPPATPARCSALGLYQAAQVSVTATTTSAPPTASSTSTLPHDINMDHDFNIPDNSVKKIWYVAPKQLPEILIKHCNNSFSTGVCNAKKLLECLRLHQPWPPPPLAHGQDYNLVPRPIPWPSFWCIRVVLLLMSPWPPPTPWKITSAGTKLPLAAWLSFIFGVSTVSRMPPWPPPGCKRVVLQLFACCEPGWLARLLRVKCDHWKIWEYKKHSDVNEFLVLVDTMVEAVLWFQPNNYATRWCLIIYDVDCMFGWSYSQLIMTSLGRGARISVHVQGTMKGYISEDYIIPDEVTGKGSDGAGMPLLQLLVLLQQQNGVLHLCSRVVQLEASWPPPLQLKVPSKGADLRPMPWPFFFYYSELEVARPKLLLQPRFSTCSSVVPLVHSGFQSYTLVLDDLSRKKLLEHWMVNSLKVGVRMLANADSNYCYLGAMINDSTYLCLGLRSNQLQMHMLEYDGRSCIFILVLQGSCKLTVNSIANKLRMEECPRFEEAMVSISKLWAQFQLWPASCALGNNFYFNSAICDQCKVQSVSVLYHLPHTIDEVQRLILWDPGGFLCNFEATSSTLDARNSKAAYNSDNGTWIVLFYAMKKCLFQATEVVMLARYLDLVRETTCILNESWQQIFHQDGEDKLQVLKLQAAMEREFLIHNATAWGQAVFQGGKNVMYLSMGCLLGRRLRPGLAMAHDGGEQTIQSAAEATEDGVEGPGTEPAAAATSSCSESRRAPARSIPFLSSSSFTLPMYPASRSF